MEINKCRQISLVSMYLTKSLKIEDGLENKNSSSKPTLAPNYQSKITPMNTPI